MAHDVFISYSYHDKNVANAVCSAVENAGIRCWIAPRDVLPGKEWGEAIVDAIGSSKVMVLIFSSASNNSQQVLREVERAVHKNLIIVPFRIEDVLPTKSMEYFLYSTHWLDAITPELEKHIDILIDVLHKLLGGVEKAEPKPASENDQTVPGKETEKAKQPVKKHRIALLMALVILVSAFGTYILVRSPGSSSLINPDRGQEPGTLTNHTVGTEIPSAIPPHPHEEQQAVTEPDFGDAGTQKPQPSAANGNTDSANMSSESSTGSDAAKNPSDNQLPEKESVGDSQADKEKIRLETGDILRVGNYYGKPIDWMVIHINSDGEPLLLSKEILTLKPFDASESGTYNKTPQITFDNKMPRDEVYIHYSQDDLRAMKGSNSWADSNIREWLNSDQKKVSYSTQPPSSDAVWYGLNDYDKEMGFLYNFTEEEKAMIKTVRHKAVIAEMDREKAAGGSAPYDFSRASLEDVWFNTDEAYYMEVEDRVFLLSVEEVMEYLYYKGHLLTAYPTEEAIRRDESGWYKDLKHQADGAFMWWLRTPNANTPCEVCIVGLEGNIIYSDYAVLCGVGVRPALYLGSSLLEVEGSGTVDDPYYMK